MQKKVKGTKINLDSIINLEDEKIFGFLRQYFTKVEKIRGKNEKQN